MLNQERLKELLHYDPDTGVFTNLVNRGNSPVGKIVSGLCAGGYKRVGLLGRRYYLHRLAFLYMTGKLPNGQVDHINHIRDDNRWVNLREVTPQENAVNRTISPRNTSGHTGVNLHKKGRWQSSIYAEGKSQYLGLFDTKEEALEARKEAEKQYNFHINHGVQLL